MKKFLAALAPVLLSVLRIVAAFLLMAHGTQKLFGLPAIEPRDPVALMSRLGTAGVLETFGGLLVLIGLYTRPVAFVLAGLMAAAYFMSHAPRGFWPILNRGELAALYSFVFLYLSVAGGGSLGLDAWLRRVK
jgi:putative oxidoreductase